LEVYALIDKLIGAMLAIVVGVVLIPVIIDSVDGLNATAVARYTGVGALTDILPLLFVIIIVGGAVAYFRYR